MFQSISYSSSIFSLFVSVEIVLLRKGQAFAGWYIRWIFAQTQESVWFSSLSRIRLCNRMDCSTPGLPVHHQLSELTQTHAHRVGDAIQPSHDLNQIPYDYKVEVRNRFKGLDLIECVINYGRRFVALYRRQGSRPSPWKRNAKKQNG